MKKVFGLILGAAAVLAGPALAHADYPTTAPIVTASLSAPVACASEVYAVDGFVPGSTVTFSVGGAVAGTAVANATGKASLAIAAPCTPGTYTVSAASGTTTVTTTITVVASLAPTAPGSGLPATGTDSGNLLQTGVVLALGGAALLGVSGFRRRANLAA